MQYSAAYLLDVNRTERVEAKEQRKEAKERQHDENRGEHISTLTSFS